jgi:hypothetical protein
VISSAHLSYCLEETVIFLTVKHCLHCAPGLCLYVDIHQEGLTQSKKNVKLNRFFQSWAGFYCVTLRFHYTNIVVKCFSVRGYGSFVGD